MNDYIINPAWFYWLEVIDDIKTIALIFGVLGSVGSSLAVIDRLIEPEEFASKKILKCLLPPTIILLILSIFLPSRQTMIEMMVAKIANRSNIDITIDALKEALEYIVQTIQSLK